MTETIPHMVWFTNSDGTAIYNNRRCFEYAGRQTLGLDWQQLIHADDLTACLGVWNRSLGTGEPFVAEYRLRRHDGTFRWHKGCANAHRGTDGAVIFWAGTCTDIDDLRQGQLEMAEREARYRTLFESNPHPMWVYDSETLAFLAVNDAAIERYGFSRDEFLAMRITDIRPAEDVETLCDCIRNGGPGLGTHGVWRHLWRDGTLRQVEVCSHACEFAGRPARMILTQDVTDRLASESASLESRAEAERSLARLQAVVSTISDGLILADRDDQLLDCNPAALRIHGYRSIEEARADWPNRNQAFVLTLTDGRPLDMDERPMRRVLHGETIKDVELRLRRTNEDAERIISFSGSPILGPGGEVELGLLTLHDVTDRRRAESELRRTANLLRAVSDGTTDAVFVKDREGRYVLCNPATCSYIGRGEAEIIGRTDAEVMEPESAKIVMERDQRIMSQGHSMTDEEVLNFGGKVHSFLATKAPHRDESGAVVGLIGISRDITLRRELERERDELVARLQLHLERLPLAYVLLDSQLRVADWNAAAEQIFGYSKSEVLGMGPPFDKILPENIWPLVSEIADRVCAGDMAAHSVNENLTKDGRRITCEWHNTPLLNADGQFAGWISIAHDITERKSLEEQYRQAQKMEAIGRLAGGVAHDFNNLLTVINGFGEIVLSRLPADDPARDLIKQMVTAGGRAANLTRQLLAFSRKAIIEPKVLDLKAAVSDLEKMLRRIIGEDIQLNVVVDPEAGSIKADPGQIEQVILNLVVNARDAMPRGGQLTIEVKNAELDSTYTSNYHDVHPGSYVVLAVSDTGCGMDRATMNRMFEPFFSTKGDKGTGLGLATVHGIVKQSEGHVSVYSEQGIGTTFRVYLPRIDARPTAGMSNPGGAVAPFR